MVWNVPLFVFLQQIQCMEILSCSLWKSSCILALASLAPLSESVWVHQWQKAISLFQHSRSLYSLFLQANTGVWYTRCYLWKICLCALTTLLLPKQLSLIHSWQSASLGMTAWMSVFFFCVWLLVTQRNKDNEGRNKMNDSAQSNRAKQSKY